MPTLRSRVLADVQRVELITSKVHVEPLSPVKNLHGVRKHYTLLIFRLSDHLPKLSPIASCLEENVGANDIR